MDPYKVLGIMPHSSEKEVKEATLPKEKEVKAILPKKKKK